MSIFISNRETLESLELKWMVGLEKLAGSDIFETKEGATASIGCFRFERGFLLENWTFTYDEFQYIVKGSEKFEIEGKTLTAHEGDIVHVQKGTVTTLSSDEGCELILVVIPSIKMLGFQFKD